MENTKLMSKILEAIFWKQFTPKQESAIKNIIHNKDLSSMEKANLICELLQIEKRENRGNISKILKS